MTVGEDDVRAFPDVNGISGRAETTAAHEGFPAADEVDWPFARPSARWGVSRGMRLKENADDLRLRPRAAAGRESEP
ncbi:MAG: hypothetical protein DVB22_001452 [Verrucomicrobia bacterium]|nr:MAG: hypothetical protein DVB22_001452 [Verrucomicrobiota bacterium]